ncbi:hypothetical protein [Sphingomonas sp. NPDC079357]|jgi:hypothetical protein|uniref:hypothetical protein n=1 Tax=Sphingomonas sp. NPDC079357 TaxID=3364518 RepID=UPI00384F5E63
MNADREDLIARQIAMIIMNFVSFLETPDENIINPDNAVEMMEYLGFQLDSIEKGFLRRLVDSFYSIAEDYTGEQREFVRSIPDYFYLEEALAADDPVRLAELEAIRDARD